MAEARLGVPGVLAVDHAVKHFALASQTPSSHSLVPRLGVRQAWLPSPGLASDACVPASGGPGVQACVVPAGCRVQGAGCRVARRRVRVRAPDSASRRQRAPGAALPRPGAAREARAEARRASGGPCHVPGRARRRRQVGAGAAGTARLRAGPWHAAAGGRGAAGDASWRAGRLRAPRRAFRAGPGKVGAAGWPRGPGGKCGAGGRGPARPAEGRGVAGGGGRPGNPGRRWGRTGLFPAAAQGPGPELGGPRGVRGPRGERA